MKNTIEKRSLSRMGPDESETGARKTRDSKRIVLSGLLVLFWATMLAGAFVGLIRALCRNENDLLIGASSWEKMNFLFVLLAGLLFALRGVYSAFRFSKGAKSGPHELLALVIGLGLGAFVLYMLIFVK